eukprot:TRINITY_DN9810_c0_g1_i2.p1 TRINITY_DN9810_c0_g1~~TRINITY_DN9810_c0_g1_i2.p1  ORF type:complete len:739 (+),score=174.66 TRINITY_DN9810_c0_g1_i2:71-2287(+)
MASLNMASASHDMRHELTEKGSTIAFKKPLGVSASFLRSFRAKTDPEATTSQVCSEHVLKETADRMCSYVSLLDGQKGDDGFDVLGPATVFVSHAWQYRFHHVVEAMLDYAADHPDTYFWFDLFVNNQNQAAELPQEWWSTTFKTSIHLVGTILLVLSPWDNPVPMTRAWCLWEILCAVTDPDVELLIRLPRSQRRAFHDGLAENFDVILDSLMKIDARKAEAYHQHDKDMIFKAIESSIGFDLMNERVKEPLRRWYLTTTVDITNAMLMMEDPSERQGRLLLNVGRALFDFGQYESALHFLRHAAATVSNLSGDVHPDVAEAIHHQSRALMKLGQMEQALDTATRGLMLRQRLHGDKHLSVAESINMQGMIHGRMADTRALERYQTALAMQEELVGKATEAYSTTCHNLGNYLSRRGDMEDGQARLQEAYELRLELYGREHPSVATTLNAMGNNVARRDPWQAMKYYQESLKIREATLGKVHSDVAQSCNNLANVKSRTGMEREAIELYERALVIRKASLGDGHPDVAMTLNNIAGVHARKNELEPAVKLCKEALDIRLAVLGPEHPDTAASHTNLAKYLLKLERVSEAKHHLELAFAVRKADQSWQRGFPYTSCCDYLVEACELLGQREEALRYAMLSLEFKVTRTDTSAIRFSEKQVERLSAPPGAVKARKGKKGRRGGKHKKQQQAEEQASRPDQDAHSSVTKADEGIREPKMAQVVQKQSRVRRWLSLKTSAN